MKRVHFFLKSEIYEKAKAAARERGQNFSEWLRGLIAFSIEVSETTNDSAKSAEVKKRKDWR